MKIFPIQDFINHESEFFKIIKSLPPIGDNGPWVAGGSVWKSIEGIPLACDIDFFFQSKQQCESWYRTILSIPYYHRILSESVSNSYNTTFKYCVPFGTKNKPFTLQLVSFKFFKDMENLLDSFDFTACQFGFDGKHLYTGNTSIDDLRNREIIINNISSYPATLHHIKKYTSIGFKLPLSQDRILDECGKKFNNNNNINILTNPCAEVNIGDPINEFPTDGIPMIDDAEYPEPIAGSDGVDLSRITSFEMPTENRGAEHTPLTIHSISPISFNTSNYITVPINMTSNYITAPINMTPTHITPLEWTPTPEDRELIRTTMMNHANQQISDDIDNCVMESVVGRGLDTNTTQYNNRGVIT